MNKKITPGSLFLILAIACSAWFVSCQKEIEGSLFSFGCKVQQWNELDSSGNLATSYSYQYDTVSGKAVLLQYNDIIGANSVTVVPTQVNDTFYFGLGSYAVVDASKRVTRLEEQNSANTAVLNGSYFYTYDANGHLATRIFDDGSGAQTTTYTFTGNDLTRVDQPALGTPNALSTSYTYTASSTVGDFNQYLYAATFPELLLYLPCLNVGTISSRVITKTTTVVNLPLPLPSLTTTYSNYSFDTHGYVKKVLLKTNITGQPDTLQSMLAGNYICR